MVADYDQNGMDNFMQGLDFNLISSVFDPYKPNAPVLSFENGNNEWVYSPFPAALVPPDCAEQYPDIDHDGIPDNVNIGCEACHGPGSKHVLNGGDPEYILAPSELDTERSNEICEQCRSPHRGGEAMIVRSIEEDGITIQPSNENNTLCLACRATHGAFEDITPEQVAAYDENLDHIRNVTEAHTNRPYGPERSMGLSRCSGCHMPQVAKSAINYDVSSHTFEAIAPEKTLMYQEQGGMPNACAVSCHAQKVNSLGLGYDPDIGDWDAQFDVDLAGGLMYWYGPGGVWWDIEHDDSSAKRAIENSAYPGVYVPPEDPTFND